MMRRLFSVFVLLSVAGLSCDSGPKAGELALDFETPENDDRAIIFIAVATEPFTITGMTADCAGCQLWVHKVSDIDWRGVLTGVPGNGPAIRLGVSDRKAVEAYTVSVTKVAGPDYELRVASSRRLVLAQ